MWLRCPRLQPPPSHRAQTQALDGITRLSASRSLLEDVDMGAAVVDLKDAEAGYQATLAIVARMQNVTLLDFLR